MGLARCGPGPEQLSGGNRGNEALALGVRTDAGSGSAADCTSLHSCGVPSPRREGPAGSALWPPRGALAVLRQWQEAPPLPEKAALMLLLVNSKFLPWVSGPCSLETRAEELVCPRGTHRPRLCPWEVEAQDREKKLFVHRSME